MVPSAAPLAPAPPPSPALERPVLDILASPVGHVLRLIHAGLSTFLIPGSGPAWGLSIVLLTIAVRLLLFPLFVKQIRSQRRMQELAPRIKELQKRHKGDRETLNTEMMKLYKDNNANPIAGCAPLILQLPVFFALFSVIREFKPGAQPKYGLSADLLREAASARIFGAPISSSFNSTAEQLADLGGGQTTVRIVAAIMVVLMGASTYYTQRQMMARATSTGADSTQMQVQKIMLYVLPLSFAVSGVIFPIGVLLYWLTTNLWSMGQQAYVIKRMPPVVGGSDGPVGRGTPPSSGGNGGGSGGGGGGKTDLTKRPAKGDSGGASPSARGRDGASAGSVPVATGTTTLGGSASAAARPGPRPNQRKKKGRPGGRR